MYLTLAASSTWPLTICITLIHPSCLHLTSKSRKRLFISRYFGSSLLATRSSEEKWWSSPPSCMTQQFVSWPQWRLPWKRTNCSWHQVGQLHPSSKTKNAGDKEKELDCWPHKAGHQVQERFHQAQARAYTKNFKFSSRASFQSFHKGRTINNVLIGMGGEQARKF